MHNQTPSKQILVVDNERMNKTMFYSFLEQHNYFNCLFVPEFQQALDYMHSNSTMPKVVVSNLDIHDDPAVGLSFISYLKQNPIWSHIPIIVLSKIQQSEIILETLNRGAVDFLSSPIDPVMLHKRIKRAYSINRFQRFSQYKVNKQILTNELDSLRELYVETMKYAVYFWEISTKLSKIELAERSGLWSVYLDKSGSFRTRTLDRYLDETTLPKNPKVKQIIFTANFVLEKCQSNSVLKQKLIHCLSQIMQSEGMNELMN